jgi:mannose-6-phosphate isomerase-like protein (cupin superfamily)
MSAKAGKVWGETRLITRNPALELHMISFRAGAMCSEHKHLTKWNGFLVLSGAMRVRVWQESGLVDETLLVSGEYCEVAPGLIHQFEGVVDGTALEVYWAALAWDDIVRRTVVSANEV